MALEPAIRFHAVARTRFPGLLFWFDRFLQKMAEFHAAYPKQAEYFSDIPHEHWAVYKQIEMAIKTYGQCTTTSLAKSEASQMLPMRNYAPLGALDKIAREMCQEADRAREEAREMLARGQILISFAQADLDEQTRLSGTCIAVKAGDGIGLVKQLTNQGAVEETVNFNAKTCTCGLWQRMGRPCRHAVKFAPLHFNPVALQIDPGLWFRFAWDPIYLVAVYSIVTEDGAIIPPDLERLIPDGVTLPPKQTGTEARAAKQRKRCATDESGNSKRTGRPLKVQKCANCREPGHKLPTCPRPVASD